MCLIYIILVDTSNKQKLYYFIDVVVIYVIIVMISINRTKYATEIAAQSLKFKSTNHKTAVK